jgi:hypothetical protein
LELYAIGHTYEIHQFVEENEDAVVDAYDAFLTDYAAELVKTSKTSNPGTILANLANRWKEKIVQSEQSAKEQAVAQAVTQTEQKLNTERQSELKAKDEYLVSEKAWWKKHALELNKDIRKYHEALMKVWETEDRSRIVRTFHVNISLIYGEQNILSFLRSRSFTVGAIYGSYTLSGLYQYDDSYFENR